MTSRLGLCDSSSLRFPRKENDAEKIQGFDGKRDSGNRYRRRRGRRADLRGVCGRASRRVSLDGGNVRGDAPRRGGPPRPFICDVPSAVRRPHSADPAGKRKGISAKETGVAWPAAGGEGRQEAGGIYGARGEPGLRGRGKQDDGWWCAGSVGEA